MTCHLLRRSSFFAPLLIPPSPPSLPRTHISIPFGPKWYVLKKLCAVTKKNMKKMSGCHWHFVLFVYHLSLFDVAVSAWTTTNNTNQPVHVLVQPQSTKDRPFIPFPLSAITRPSSIKVSFFSLSFALFRLVVPLNQSAIVTSLFSSSGDVRVGHIPPLFGSGQR